MVSILEVEPAPRRRPSRVNWNALAVIVALIVAMAGWFRDDSKDHEAESRVIEARISVLETQRSNDTQRMERIEGKLDRLLERAK
jgi:hypothetical protein